MEAADHGKNTLELIVLVGIACFFLQWAVLGFIFKNIRVISMRSKTFYLLPFICTIAAMIVTNNWVLSEETNNYRRVHVMFYVMNSINFVVLISSHFIIGFLIKKKSNNGQPE